MVDWYSGRGGCPKHGDEDLSTRLTNRQCGLPFHRKGGERAA